MSTEHHNSSEHLDRLRGAGDGFTSPGAAYFERLTRRAIESEQNAAGCQSSGRRRRPAVVVRTLGRRSWKAGLAIAAAVLLLLSLWQFALTPASAPATNVPLADNEFPIASEPTSAQLLADLDPVEVDAYIDRYFFEFEELVEINYLND